MLFFIIIFLIIAGLIRYLDYYFYTILTNLLNTQNLDSKALLNSLGYYNNSMFNHWMSIVILAFFVSVSIYTLYYFLKLKENKKINTEIKALENYLVQVNKGDYSIQIKEENQFNSLRDEIYKVIVNLKTLEKKEKSQKKNLKIDLENIAHQLKTPITSIGFMTELIIIDKENIDIYLPKLKIELNRLENFTEILLKLSKVNSDTINYTYEEVSILTIIKEVTDELNKSQTVEIEYFGEDFMISADKTWLRESLLNIIKNSMEFTKDKIEIKFNSNPIYKKLEIKDNGQGLEKEELGKIFDRYYRGNTSHKGYGIGLNLSKAIIEKHNGEIAVYNDEGLTFQIKFYNVT